MRKLIAIVMMLIPVFVWGETVDEGLAKHPDATLYYCKKKTWKGIPTMSAIERVAFIGNKGKIFIKFFNQDEEMECSVNGHSEDVGDVTFFPLINGKIGIDVENERIIWVSSGNDIIETFKMDIEKTCKALMKE